MHHPHAALTPVNRPAHPTPPDPAIAPDPFSAEAVPTRVIEIGEVTAGIAVPEGRRVRFFSSSRDFDGLDGAVFGSTEQAARAARERARALARPAGQRSVRAISA